MRLFDEGNSDESKSRLIRARVGSAVGASAEGLGDGTTEGMRDGETEGTRDGETAGVIDGAAGLGACMTSSREKTFMATKQG